MPGVGDDVAISSGAAVMVNNSLCLERGREATTVVFEPDGKRTTLELTRQKGT